MGLHGLESYIPHFPIWFFLPTKLFIFPHQVDVLVIVHMFYSDFLHFYTILCRLNTSISTISWRSWSYIPTSLGSFYESCSKYFARSGMSLILIVSPVTSIIPFTFSYSLFLILSSLFKFSLGICSERTSKPFLMPLSILNLFSIISSWHVLLGLALQNHQCLYVRVSCYDLP